MCTSIASPVSTSSTDDSRADHDLSKGRLPVPVDEWSSQYNRAFEVMRRYFYNSAEHHDLKLLPHGRAGQLKKRAIYKQRACKIYNEQIRLARLAMKSKQSGDEEKKAVNTRYLLQKKKPTRNGHGVDPENNANPDDPQLLKSAGVPLYVFREHRRNAFWVRCLTVRDYE